MERLTKKRDRQNVIPLKQNGETKWVICSAGMGDAPTEYLYGEHADRLAAYEDTGLEPCDYSAMAHALEQAERAREDLTEMIRQIGATGLDRLRELAPADKEGISPCTFCRFNPPSSGDGKPCCMCPAEAALRREKLMANKPVIGYQVCPYCGGKVTVIWDGNRKETCMYCKKRFQLKRQKLKNTMRVNCPPEGEVGMVKYIGNGGDQNGATDI